MDNNATISSQLSIVNCQLSILKSYFPTLTDAQKQQIDALFDLYSDWKFPKINVISRKDIENLYLHHVLHSLGILKNAEIQRRIDNYGYRYGRRFSRHTTCESCSLKYSFIW